MFKAGISCCLGSEREGDSQHPLKGTPQWLNFLSLDTTFYRLYPILFIQCYLGLVAKPWWSQTIWNTIYSGLQISWVLYFVTVEFSLINLLCWRHGPHLVGLIIKRWLNDETSDLINGLLCWQNHSIILENGFWVEELCYGLNPGMLCLFPPHTSSAFWCQACFFMSSHHVLLPHGPETGRWPWTETKPK